MEALRAIHEAGFKQSGNLSFLQRCMAAFAKGVYDAVAYSAFRPTYPRRLFDSLWAFHASGIGRRSDVSWQRAVDLGCGTGMSIFRTMYEH